MADLYIVSTPIGNLGDLSQRAVEVLRSADRILAEDTRRTAILCRAYGIETPLRSSHEHNEAGRAEQAVAWLDAGETLALVTDAGTPVLSDPGARLVSRVVEAGHEVVPIPGASALLAALVGSGLPSEPFTFYGFLARSGRERKERLAELETLPHTAVVYESPERLVALLEDPDRDVRIAAARALGALEHSAARGALEGAIQGKRLRAADRSEKLVFFEALGRIGGAGRCSPMSTSKVEFRQATLCG